jgi:hypothetical protein
MSEDSSSGKVLISSFDSMEFSYEKLKEFTIHTSIYINL